MTGGALAQTPLAQSPLLASRGRIWPLVLVSLALHVAFFGGALYYRRTPRVNLEQKPIVAKLVRLGEKRPEQFLPRKEAEPPPAPGPVAAAPPAAPPRPAAPKPVQPPKPAPAQVTVPSPAATARVPKTPPPAGLPAGPRTGAGGSDRLASVLSRMRREQALSGPVYGDPEGDPNGDSAEGSPGDVYLALVERALRESYTLPSTISEADRVRLKATVVLYLDDTGRVVRFAFENRSGNAAFDAALERAIGAARIPAPPPELRKRYRDEGLGVLYRP